MLAQRHDIGYISNVVIKEREMSDSIFVWALVVASVLAWFTHIFTCFAEGLWGFLIAGALFFPVGILHGFWLWFR